MSRGQVGIEWLGRWWLAPRDSAGLELQVDGHALLEATVIAACSLNHSANPPTPPLTFKSYTRNPLEFDSVRSYRNCLGGRFAA